MFLEVLKFFFLVIFLWSAFVSLCKWASFVYTFHRFASTSVFWLMWVSNVDSSPELCGTDTHSLRHVGWNWDFISSVFRNRIWGSHSPPLVAYSVLQLVSEHKLNPCEKQKKNKWARKLTFGCVVWPDHSPLPVRCVPSWAAVLWAASPCCWFGLLA